MTKIENKTFAELNIGDSASFSRRLSPEDVARFADISGDVSPDHVDAGLTKSDVFHDTIVQSMWGNALISTLVGIELPGPGSVFVNQTFQFKRLVKLGDIITVSVKVAKKSEADHRVQLDFILLNQNDQTLIEGSVDVIAPLEKVSRDLVELGDDELPRKGRHYRQLLKQCIGLPPLRTAVVHPVDANSLLGAIAAAKANLIEPVLIGPEEKILAAAAQAQIDLTPYRLVATEHSHAAAAKAVEMACRHEVEALMKGSLHTDELMHAIVSERLLCTERRMSHVFVIDAPGYPRPLYMSDAAINVYPTLEEKRDIIQNAIDLAHALHLMEPKVAILSAVETVTDKIKSTIDAAALCKMADRRQIVGAIIDGPLAFDNAVSFEAAKTKGIISPVAGQADIFIVPDLESGNMLAKQLEYLAEADMAGIVLGARVPIILTSRADKTLARLSSCAVALLLARHKEGSPG